MKHLVQFSGGKDSTALVLWAKEHLPEFEAIFLDTGWEHPLTYAYVQEINETVLDGKLQVLKSEKYDGFADLVVQRQMVPGVRSRFCTQELKIFPFHRYLETLDDEVTSYVGIRRDESSARSKMTPQRWVDDAGGYWLAFPLFDWTAAQCFNLMQKYGVKPNPLYTLGMGRVGCWPCIMVNKTELREAFRRFPDLRDRLVSLESRLNEGRTEKDYHAFFRTDFIPARYCSKTIQTKDGRQVKCPTAADVYDYLTWEDENQLALFDVPTPKCMSVYNLCE